MSKPNKYTYMHECLASGLYVSVVRCAVCCRLIACSIMRAHKHQCAYASIYVYIYVIDSRKPLIIFYLSGWLFIDKALVGDKLYL